MTHLNILSGFHAIIKNLIHHNIDLQLTNFRFNSESAEYNACSFNLNEKAIVYRSSKITPTKIGQFVTIWKRKEDGQTAPFDISDDLDFIVIASKRGNERGLFVFPKSVLVEQKIVSQTGTAGKRGIRVYPPWDTVISKQAKRSQVWQTEYFLSIEGDNACDAELARKLFGNIRRA